uniref:Uncharacterized protein n=1 Tax=Oryza sativa subsp. japonica TaxID=39947 RepID=Q6EN75_ORYSJ|nr:hypothetical protein [Oryza sativa Japonica Group]BAD29660.1 hypothetical protein [Oryza sativa Japonica Group]
MATASLVLLRSTGRSLLQRPIIPRALEELSFSPRCLMETPPRRLYSSDVQGTKPPPPSPHTYKASQLETAEQDLVEKNKALEEHMISRMGNLNRALDALEGRIDRLRDVLKEREVQYQKLLIFQSSH